MQLRDENYIIKCTAIIILFSEVLTALECADDPDNYPKVFIKAGKTIDEWSWHNIKKVHPQGNKIARIIVSQLSY